MINKKPSHFRIALFSLAVFVLLETIASLVVWKIYINKETFILDRDAEVFEDVYISTRRGYSMITELLYNQIINTPEIIDIFEKATLPDAAQRDLARKQLYEALLPTYKSLQSINLRQLHFHLPDVTSFLRFHKPEKYGDSLVGIRTSLEIANRDKIYVEGFEEGRVYNGFRHVYPLFNNEGRHLGSVETSLSFRALSEEIERTTGYVVDFVVKKSIVERKVWAEEQSNYFSSLISDAYLHEREAKRGKESAPKFQEVKRLLSKKASEKMRENCRFALYCQGVIVSFLPIANVEGEAGAAYLISFNESQDISGIRTSLLLVWGLSTLAVILIVALGILLFQKMLQINALATFDALTGLLNRNALSERVRMEIARFRRTGEAFSLLYLDVDDFKSINDRYGHEVGDRVLRMFAEILKTNTRDIDASGRWGGEEFLICLPETDGSRAAVVAEKLRQKVENHDFRLPVNITSSFGVATVRDGEGMDALVARTDKQLYRAKSEGKNRVCVE